MLLKIPMNLSHEHFPQRHAQEEQRNSQSYVAVATLLLYKTLHALTPLFWIRNCMFPDWSLVFYWKLDHSQTYISTYRFKILAGVAGKHRVHSHRHHGLSGGAGLSPEGASASLLRWQPVRSTRKQITTLFGFPFLKQARKTSFQGFQVSILNN